MKVFITSFILILSSHFAQAKIEVLFHPHDPTLEKISAWIAESHTVDIAMYNMDTTDQSPIIQMLKSPATSEKIQSGSLKIRLLFEGYGSPEGNAAKMQALENTGIDVRFLGNLVKVHHKFAVLDAASPQSRVITGSANWSLSSAKNYNENILFVSEESEATARYQKEFDRLWNKAQEFGVALPSAPPLDLPYQDEEDIEVFFNSPRTVTDASETHTDLTAELVHIIDDAKSTLQIATTRARLYPVLEALVRAADRGVQVSLLLSQDDYRDLYKRSKYLLSHANIQTRIKFYHLNVDQYLAYQMHNKFLIADGQLLLTGSFNWSQSSENKHIENLIEIKGAKAQEVLPAYQQEFKLLWDLGRKQYGDLEKALTEKTWQGCEMPQMSLSAPEIEILLKLSPECRNKSK